MTYSEAMNLVCSGGIVKINSTEIYMSVDFNKGLAGEIVYYDGISEQKYEASQDDIDSESWSS